jgi:hypothetical protein
MFPDGDVGSGSVLAVVEEHDHAIRIHGFADEELVVLEICDDLLCETGGAGFEGFNVVFGGALLFEGFFYFFHVCCWFTVSFSFSRARREGLDGGVVGGKGRTLEVRQVGFLVKLRLGQAKAVGDVQDGLGVVVEFFVAALGRGVAAHVEGFSANVDLFAVGFVGDVVDELEIVRV